MVARNYTTTVVEFAILPRAGSVFVAVVFGVEMSALITVLASREPMTVFCAMVIRAARPFVGAGPTVLTFIVGRLTHVRTFHQYLLSSVWFHKRKFSSAEAGRLLIGVADQPAFAVFRSAFADVAFVHRELLAKLACEVIAFLGHCWVSQIKLFDLLNLHFSSRQVN